MYSILFRICTISNFSKLTMYPAPMPYFASTNEWVGTTLQLIENFQSSLNITVRLCFALGNLASRNNQIRENLFFNQRVLDSTTGYYLIFRNHCFCTDVFTRHVIIYVKSLPSILLFKKWMAGLSIL